MHQRKSWQVSLAEYVERYYQGYLDAPKQSEQ